MSQAISIHTMEVHRKFLHVLLDHCEKYFRFITEPFVGTTGKCHQQRLASDKKTNTPLPQQQRHTHCQQSPLPTLVTPPEDTHQTPQQQATVAMRPVGCAELEDLIHLAGPLTEDAVLKCLQARFCASQFFVSISCLLLAAYFGSTSAYFFVVSLFLIRLHPFHSSCSNPSSPSSFPYFFSSSSPYYFLLHIVFLPVLVYFLLILLSFSCLYPLLFHFSYYLLPTYFNSSSTFPCTTVFSFLFFFPSITFLILLHLFYSSPSFLMSIHHFISSLLLFISLYYSLLFPSLHFSFFNLFFLLIFFFYYSLCFF